MAISPVDSCAFLPCDQVDECCLEGGCVVKRFPGQQPHPKQSDLEPGARKLAGSKPARTNRDPALIKRRRKALTK